MRYLLVAYQYCAQQTGVIGFGNIAFESTEFPSQQSVIDNIHKIQADPIKGNPVIMNIFEFKNKKDYLCYCNKLQEQN